MEARDTSERIRLLPPDAPREPPDQEQGPNRGWVGPAVLIGVIAVFALFIGLGSAPDETASIETGDATAPSLGIDVEATTTAAPAEPAATTAAPPPPLLEQVPDLSAELHLVGTVANSDGSSSVVTALWNGRLSAPGSPQVFDRTYPAEMSFARNTRMLAVLGSRLGDGVATLYVGSTSSLSPQFVGATSFEWMEGDALEIAFVGRPPGSDRTSLYRASVAPSGALTDVVAVTEVGPNTQVTGAGGWGYLVTDGTFISATTLLDVDGAPLRSVAGTVLDVTAAGDFVLASAQPALDVALDSGATVTDLGFLVEPVRVENGPFSILDIEFNEAPRNQSVIDALSNGYVEFSPDGSLVIGTGPSVGDRWSVRTAALDEALGRTTSIVAATAFLGWSGDGNYLMYATDAGMAFHNWDRGTTHYVSFPRDYDLVTVGS